MNQNRTQAWWLLGAIVVLGVLIYYLSPILAPFMIAFVLAYLTDPIVNKLIAIKIPRTFAVIIVFISLFTLIGLLLLLLVPLLERQVILLINKVPQMVAWIQQQALPWLATNFGIKQLVNVQAFKQFLTEHWAQAGSVASSLWETVTYSGSTIFIYLFNLVMIPVVTFYLLRDWERIRMGVQKLFPRRYEKLLQGLLSEFDEVLSAFFRGQLLVMLSLGIYYVAGLWLVGLELALSIGFIIGLISIVPYLGFIVGLALAIIASLVQFHDGLHVLYILIIFGIGSVLENTILAPLLVGDRIGLHPVAVIFAVLAGGQLFGITGVLLALPVAAMLMVLIRHGRQSYLKSEMYGEVEQS